MNPYECRFSGFVDIPQFKRRRPNPSMPTPKENNLRQIGREEGETCSTMLSYRQAEKQRWMYPVPRITNEVVFH